MTAPAFLEVRGLRKSFQRRRWWRRDPAPMLAVRDVDLSLARGEVLALVGPSGSGKSTVARCLALFEEPDAGDLLLDGQDLRPKSAAQRRARRADVQLIFQDAAASLNPRFTAEEILAEPPLIQGKGTAASRRQTAEHWLRTVDLPPDSLRRNAMAFSGGERQRLAIARALVLEPKLLILDESLSGLDLALQMQLGELLLNLHRQLGLTSILISHDFALVGRLAGRIAVMEAGSIVESGPAEQVLRRPQHALTRELLESARALSLPGVL